MTLADGSRVYFVEAFVDGRYIKHSNNTGWVGMDELSGAAHQRPVDVPATDEPRADCWTADSDTQCLDAVPIAAAKRIRNTPQALSYFSWHYSRGSEMICDVQGIGDLYTDPQIHSADPKLVRQSVAFSFIVPIS